MVKREEAVPFCRAGAEVATNKADRSDPRILAKSPIKKRSLTPCNATETERFVRTARKLPTDFGEKPFRPTLTAQNRLSYIVVENHGEG